MNRDPRDKMTEDRGPGHTTTDADAGGPALRTTSDRRLAKAMAIGVIHGGGGLGRRTAEQQDRDMIRRELHRLSAYAKRKLRTRPPASAAGKIRVTRKQ